MGRGVVKLQRRITHQLYFTSSPWITPAWAVPHRRLQFGGQQKTGGRKMNLYRSFGNLMESWVADAGHYSDAARLGSNGEDLPTPSSDTGTSPRPDSVDSGVETASSVMSSPATPSSVTTDNAGREAHGLTSALPSQSPTLSSSSSSSPVPGASGALRVSVDEMLMRRPRASTGPTRHASWVARGQRSRSFALKRSANAPVPTTQTSEPRRRSIACCDIQADQTKSQDLDERERAPLSPGLRYLEQVCQMLEEIARQQMRSRALQMETDALQEDQNIEVDQAPATCQRDSKSAEEELTFCPKNTKSAEHSEALPGRDHLHRHFRQRSASDTNISTLYRRKLKADCRGQHLTTDDLPEMDEEEHEKQGSEKEETTKKRAWKIKFGSFTKAEWAVTDTDSQKTQSSERSSARRRLSQMFRRKKAPPV